MRARPRRSRQRGVTLIELMISLMVVVTGLLVVFKAIGTSVAGSAASSRFAQAQARAETIIEAIRLSPDDALTCMRNTAPSGWAACELVCDQRQLAYGVGAHPSSCIFTTARFNTLNGPTTHNITGATITNQTLDRLGQFYIINATGQPLSQTDPAKYGSTYVRQVGAGLRTWEAVVTVSWNDDNSNRTTPFPDHSVTLVTGIFK